MCPVPSSEGYDAPRLAGELVPRLAAVGDDVVVGVEDPVREPILAHELPDVLHRVQLGRARRQLQGVVGDDEPAGDVLAGLVEDDYGVRTGRNCRADLGEVGLHRLGVGERHDEGRAIAESRADRAEDAGPFGALVMWRPGAGAATRPPAGDQVVLTIYAD